MLSDSPATVDSCNSPLAVAAEFSAQLWTQLIAIGGWHAQLQTHFDALTQAIANTPPAELIEPVHPLWDLLQALHPQVIGYQPDLGKSAERGLGDIAAALAALPGENPTWSHVVDGIRELGAAEQLRQQRIEQRLIDAAHGQWRSQRARQQAAQLLNRCMAGKKLSADIAAWLQGEWFNELQWCLLHHGDAGSAWQRRAETTLALVASLQPPTDDAGARQNLYTQIPEVTATLRTLLEERAHSAGSVDESLARIEQQHLQLLRGRQPQSAPFKLIVTENPWLADISLSRELLVRTEALAPGQWFLLREDGERRIKLILKQQDVGQLLFVNQLGVKVLQVSTEEFAYRLAADLALPLPGANFARAIFEQVRQALAASAEDAARVRAEADAALQRERERARERIETEARQRALAKAKAAAEAKVLAAEQARIAAAEQARLAELEQARREQEQAQREQELARESAAANQRERIAKLAAATLAIGQWLELRDNTGQLQWLKLAVKLQSSGKLIFVDREGLRQADFTREQLVAHLLEGSARIAEQGQQFEDTLARVVDGMRLDRNNRES